MRWKNKVWMTSTILVVSFLTGCAGQLASANKSESKRQSNPFEKNGFEVRMEDDRLWVFRDAAKELSDFDRNGELAKHVTHPAMGPAGLTIKAPDNDTIIEYLSSKSGFYTQVMEGRLWIFQSGSKELSDFQKHGELAKHVTRPAAGPLNCTVKAPDHETLLTYFAARTGFYSQIVEGRLWVFQVGSKELADFQKHGELAKHVTRPGIGPLGCTLKAPNNETLIEFIATRPGFHCRLVDGRLWVFRVDSKELADFQKHGELAKQVIRPGAGPLGCTLKAPDGVTADRFVRVMRSGW